MGGQKSVDCMTAGTVSTSWGTEKFPAVQIFMTIKTLVVDRQLP